MTYKTKIKNKKAGRPLSTWKIRRLHYVTPKDFDPQSMELVTDEDGKKVAIRFKRKAKN